jgi:tetratricopeptide (TPR) repeat protein
MNTFPKPIWLGGGRRFVVGAPVALVFHAKSRLDFRPEARPLFAMLLRKTTPVIVAALLAAAGASAQAPLPAAVPGGPAPGNVETRAQKLARLKNRGLQFFEGGKYAEATQQLEEFLRELTPEEKRQEVNKVTYLVLAESYFRLKKEENFLKAINYWNTYITTWPTDPIIIQIKSAIAQTYMEMKKWETAIEWWGQVESLAKAPELLGMREHSLSGQAHCFKQLKKPEDEITVLERLVYPDFNTTVSAEGAVRLMSLYALKHDPVEPKTIEFAEKAVELLKKLQTKIHLVENFVALNGIAIKLGDELLDVNAYAKALEAYWAVRSRDVVSALQRQRIAGMEQLMTARLNEGKAKAAQDGGRAHAAALRENETTQQLLDEAKKILAEFEKLEDFMPTLYFRMARCHADMGKKWEAIVVFNQTLADFPNSPVRELVMFSRLALYADLGIADRTYALCDDYLKEFPTGPHAGEAAYIKGITAMRKKDWYMAEQHFEAAQKVLGTLPEDQRNLYWTEVRYQLGNSRFLQNKFDIAKNDFNGFIAEFGQKAGGKGPFMEDAEYQLALCHLFTGHYQRDPDKKGGDDDGAIERLRAYLAKWGAKANYASDGKYRLGVCQFAAYENEEAVATCKEWLAAYANNERELLQPEVHALMGDALAALKKHAEAGAQYIESYKHKNVTEEVLVYSLFEAGKQLQKEKDWQKIDEIYTEFVKTRPEHPQAVTCIYWMGKAKYKLGKMEEAKKITTEALQKHIADPKREGVEMMLSQLAEWSRRRPQNVIVAPNADGTPAKWDADAELERMLKPLRENANATAELRLKYAFGELHRIGRQADKRVAVIAEIADTAKPEDLSPHLLMECGDLLMSRNQADRAEVLYRKLKEDFRKAERVDAGWVGLADVHFARKDFKKAMELYTYAIDRLGAPWKLKEALIGQAKCQIEFAAEEKNEDTAKEILAKAKKTFEEVASVREWRGESTALALWHIAEIQFRMRNFVEATAGWERMTASMNKYPVWVARAYLRAGEGYFRQGKDDLARVRLRELFDPRNEKGEPDEKRIEKFKGLPEVEQAKKRFTELGGSV